MNKPKCTCPCHQEGVIMLHAFPCCENCYEEEVDVNVKKDKKIIIKGCHQCPFKEEGDSYSHNGYSIGRNWYCSKLEGRKIATFIESVSDGLLVERPDDCPLEDND